MEVHLAIDRLRSNAAVIDSLTRGVSEEQAKWKPTPEEWSLLEVVNHLADEEVEDFRFRLDLTLRRPGERWPAINPQGWAEERRYNSREFRESVESFLARRERSLQWLDGLEEPDWTAASEHPIYRRMTAADLMAAWVTHDLLHVRQITRLHHQYARAEMFPGMKAEYAGEW